MRLWSAPHFRQRDRRHFGNRVPRVGRTPTFHLPEDPRGTGIAGKRHKCYAKRVSKDPPPNVTPSKVGDQDALRKPNSRFRVNDEEAPELLNGAS